MSLDGSVFRSLGNIVMVGVIVVGLGLGVLLMVLKANEEETAETDESEEGAGDSHPEGEVLIFKFREMFDYNVGALVNDGRGTDGITPITLNPASKKAISLEELLVLAEKINRNVEDLADGSTRVEQSVGWFVHDGRLHYMVLLRPFERVAHELMKQPGEDLFVSFLDAEGSRVVPASAPEQIATRDLRVAVMGERRVPAGWVTYGELPLQEVDGEVISKPKIGWIFSGRLHARLRQLQRGSILRAEGVHDPFQLDVEAKGQVQR